MSLTIVAGLQLTYTTFFVCNFNMFCIVFSSNPFLGGSTIIAVGFIPFLFISLSNANSTSPHINSAFSTLFIFAFSFASSIACSTISIPYTCFTFFDANIPIVPIPQYKSNSVSSLSSFAASMAVYIKFLPVLGLPDKMTLAIF